MSKQEKFLELIKATKSVNTWKTYVSAMNIIGTHEDSYWNLSNLTLLINSWNCSDTTIKLRLSVIHNYLQYSSLLTPQLHKVLSGYKANRKIPQVLTKEQYESILESANTKWKPAILLASQAGLRLQEVIGIEIENINWNQKSILINNRKNKNSLVIGMTNEIENAISNWLLERKLKSKFLFCGTTANALQKYIAGIGDYCGVPWLHFHLFRHYFATTMLKNGLDLETLRQQLDHSSLAVTSRYLHIQPEDRTELPRQHPVERRYGTSDGTIQAFPRSGAYNRRSADSRRHQKRN